ncbi:MAG TPA: DNA translocase FtsK [Ruminococcus sp.]|nr:DNA translocase FtsK [Ruminococcus sp.]
MAEKKKKKSSENNDKDKKDDKKDSKPKEEKTDAVKEYEAIKNKKNRTNSVILFAVGFTMLLMVAIPGTEGWNFLHKFMWGMFGISALIVPFILMMVAVSIGKEKTDEDLKQKTFFGVLIALLASAAVQIFYVGEIPGDSFGSYISELYKQGAEQNGGGLASFPIAGLLLLTLGSVGARIVAIILFCVLFMLFKGIGITQFFEMLMKPFRFLGKSVEGLQTMVNGGDFYEAFDDDDDYDDEQERADFDADLEAIELVNNREEFSDIIDPVPDFLSEPENYDSSLSEKIKGIKEKKIVRDDTGFMIDIPIEENQDNSTFAPPHEKKKNKNEDNQSDDNLEKLIKRAADEKKKKNLILNKGKQNNKKEIKDSQETVYVLPNIELLSPPSDDTNGIEAMSEMREKADIIVNTLKSFNVEVKIKNIFRGPSITRYEIQPGIGVKVSKIRGLEDDIALNLAAKGVRIEAPVPGKSVIGIEVPNENKDTVTIREIIGSDEFRNSKSKLTFAVGKDIAGNIILGDIAKMPHVIIAGTTGSGKSVCTRSIIMSILYNASPDEVKFILIDPKIVEFKVFEGIPQLLIPIVTDAKKAAGALNWAVNEMMRRYQTFADVGANDLKSYNQLADEDKEFPPMPQIVIFIDELADMMLVAKNEVEDSICRLAQMGRAAGMHLVVATQRPTTDVITGLIKANIPSRIALSVMSQVDSRTIIDQGGADKLLGNGDMLYLPIGSTDPLRVQGCFASNKDIAATLDYIKSHAGGGEYDRSIMQEVESYTPQSKNDHDNYTDSGFEIGSDEDYIERAIEVAVNLGQISTSMLQRKLKLGYARAARIMDELEEKGVVGPSEGAKPRKVLMSKLQYDERRLRMEE